MVSYDRTHWEELTGVIIGRMGGAENFLEMVAYVLEQQGLQDTAKGILLLLDIAADEDAKAAIQELSAHGL